MPRRWRTTPPLWLPATERRTLPAGCFRVGWLVLAQGVPSIRSPVPQMVPGFGVGSTGYGCGGSGVGGSGSVPGSGGNGGMGGVGVGGSGSGGNGGIGGVGVGGSGSGGPGGNGVVEVIGSSHVLGDRLCHTPRMHADACPFAECCLGQSR